MSKKGNCCVFNIVLRVRCVRERSDRSLNDHMIRRKELQVRVHKRIIVVRHKNLAVDRAAEPHDNCGGY